MKAYLLTTGIIFLMNTLMLLYRNEDGSDRVAAVIAAGFCAWALGLLWSL